MRTQIRCPICKRGFDVHVQQFWAGTAKVSILCFPTLSKTIFSRGKEYSIVFLIKNHPSYHFTARRMLWIWFRPEFGLRLRQRLRQQQGKLLDLAEPAKKAKLATRLSESDKSDRASSKASSAPSTTTICNTNLCRNGAMGESLKRIHEQQGKLLDSAEPAKRAKLATRRSESDKNDASDTGDLLGSCRSDKEHRSGWNSDHCRRDKRSLQSDQSQSKHQRSRRSRWLGIL